MVASSVEKTTIAKQPSVLEDEFEQEIPSNNKVKQTQLHKAIIEKVTQQHADLMRTIKKHQLPIDVVKQFDTIGKTLKMKTIR